MKIRDFLTAHILEGGGGGWGAYKYTFTNLMNTRISVIFTTLQYRIRLPNWIWLCRSVNNKYNHPHNVLSNILTKIKGAHIIVVGISYDMTSTVMTRFSSDDSRTAQLWMLLPDYTTLKSNSPKPTCTCGLSFVIRFDFIWLYSAFFKQTKYNEI